MTLENFATVLRSVYGDEEMSFSLDSSDPQDPFGADFKKVYQPAWLQGTAVGEILFDADYLMKRLSLQDVDFPQTLRDAGFRSVLEMSFKEG